MTLMRCTLRSFGTLVFVFAVCSLYLQSRMITRCHSSPETLENIEWNNVDLFDNSSRHVFLRAMFQGHWLYLKGGFQKNSTGPVVALITRSLMKQYLHSREVLATGRACSPSTPRMPCGAWVQFGYGVRTYRVPGV